MADKKISQLTAATTPLAGTEVLPIVQSGNTVKVQVSDLSGGLSTTSVAKGGTGKTSWTANGVLYASGTGTLANGSGFTFDGTNASCSGVYTSTNTVGFQMTYAGDQDLRYAIPGVVDWRVRGDYATGNINFYQAGGLGSVAAVTLGGNLWTSGNFVVGTSGKGIDFSATANSGGTMTSELLSDYEEGTWTPTLIRGAGFSYTPGAHDSGYYTKIGRVVYCVFNFDGTFSGGSGLYGISGLPFTTPAYSGFNAYTATVVDSSTGSGSPGIVLLMGGSSSSATLFGSPTSGDVHTCSFYYHV